MTMKIVYGNPKEPEVNVFLALAVWITLNSAALCNSEKLFLRKGVEYGSASKKYYRQLAELMKRHNDAVVEYINLRRASPHGVRKVRQWNALSVFTILYSNHIILFMQNRGLQHILHLAVYSHHLSLVFVLGVSGLLVKLWTHTSSLVMEETVILGRSCH